MDTIASRLQQQYPDTNTNWVVNLFSLHDEVVSDARPALFMLTGAVAFVLLIACANVANLLLARATSRAKELAVRSALGAGAGRLLRQLLTESLVLSIAGACVGVLMAAWGLEFAKSITSEWLPRSWEIAINAPVLLFTVAAALVTGIVFGLAPGLHVHAIRAERHAEERRTRYRHGRPAAPPHRLRDRRSGVGLRAAIGAGLLIRSFQQLQSVRPGFQPAVDPHGRPLAARRALRAADLASRLRRPAAVTCALHQERPFGGARVVRPFDGKETLLTFEVEGEPASRPADRRLAQWRVVSDGFFETMGVPVVRGRTFTPRDTRRRRGWPSSARRWRTSSSVEGSDRPADHARRSDRSQGGVVHRRRRRGGRALSSARHGAEAAAVLPGEPAAVSRVHARRAHRRRSDGRRADGARDGAFARPRHAAAGRAHDARGRLVFHGGRAFQDEPARRRSRS